MENKYEGTGNRRKATRIAVIVVVLSSELNSRRLLSASFLSLSHSLSGQKYKRPYPFTILCICISNIFEQNSSTKKLQCSVTYM